MSDPKTPSSFSVSPWWGLLLLVPAALFAGKFIAGMPAPPPTSATDTAMHGSAPLTEAGPSGPAVRTSTPSSGTFAEGGTNAQGPRGDLPAAAVPVPVPTSVGDGTMHWMSLEEAWTESERTGKPVMIDFNADWCGPCQRLRHEVFENSAVAGAIDAAVVPVSIVDRKRENGSNPPEIQNLQNKFGIKAFPTLVILSPTTGKVVRTEGAWGPEQTREWIVGGAAAVR